MQNANFKCPITNEKFYIPKYRLIVSSTGNSTYKDPYGKQVINPINGAILEPLPLPEELRGIPNVMPNISEQKVRNGKFFKDRAKKHSSSEEQQALKKKRFNEEFKLDS